MKLPSISALSQNQWYKVTDAAFHSFISGFIGGLILSLDNIIASQQSVDEKVLKSLLFAGVTGGVNTLWVYVKQLLKKD